MIAQRFFGKPYLANVPQFSEKLKATLWLFPVDVCCLLILKPLGCWITLFVSLLDLKCCALMRVRAVYILLLKLTYGKAFLNFESVCCESATGCMWRLRGTFQWLEGGLTFWQVMYHSGWIGCSPLIMCMESWKRNTITVLVWFPNISISERFWTSLLYTRRTWKWWSLLVPNITGSWKYGHWGGQKTFKDWLMSSRKLVWELRERTICVFKANCETVLSKMKFHIQITIVRDLVGLKAKDS